MAHSSSWRQAAQQQPWEASWQDEWSGGKGKKGTKKGKGKRPSSWSQEGDEAPTEHTGRILARYQLAHKLLRTASAEDGSAFVKAEKQKVNDFALLQSRNLKKLVGNGNHHLLRRPGVGLSEAAGTLQAAASVVKNMKNLARQPLEKLLSDGAVADALQMLNTLKSTEERNAGKLEKAFVALQKAIEAGGKQLEESVIKATIMASRLYLCGIHLLPLAACMDDPDWWCNNVPDSLSENKKFHSWKEAPGSKNKMVKALAALMMEKIEDATGVGANDAATIFGRSMAAKGKSEDSSEADRKGKKAKNGPAKRRSHHRAHPRRFPRKQKPPSSRRRRRRLRRPRRTRRRRKGAVVRRRPTDLRRQRAIAPRASRASARQTRT